VGCLAIGVVAVAGIPSTRADRITLRGGGEIKGVVIADPAQPKSIVVQTATSAKPLTFAKDQVLKVTRESGPLDDYLARKDKVGPTAQEQYDFGLWCEEQKLTGPADGQFRKAVAIDPQFGPGHKKLGHVLQGTRWLTYDEQREAQGLVKYKGKWVAKAEKEKLDAKAALSAEQASWASRIKVLRRKLYEDDPAIRRDAEAQIAAIRDPAAIPGLMQAFAIDGDAVRIRLAQLLSVIQGPEATEALVRLLLCEPDPDVRRSMLEELVRKHDPDWTTRMIAALKFNDPDIVGRAAWALAATKTTTAVPRLVEALFQIEKQDTLMVPGGGSGGGGGGLAGSYGIAQNVTPGAGVVHPNAAQQGFTTVQTYGYLTGAAVAPGAVAFGAGGTPMVGGSTPTPTITDQDLARSVVVKLSIPHPNYEVLKALQSLTNENFGFDSAAWKRWVSTSFHPDPGPARRVPQPN
jgi:hypothetical protein